jgi:hypothetical protein
MSLLNFDDALRLICLGGRVKEAMNMPSPEYSRSFHLLGTPYPTNQVNGVDGLLCIWQQIFQAVSKACRTKDFVRHYSSASKATN